MPVFRHRCELDQPPEEVFAWHERPGAFQRLVPPWESIRVRSQTGGVRGKVCFGIRRGPIELTWEIERTGYEAGRLLVDEQVKGPFGHWQHEHRFESIGRGRTALVDVVDWAPPRGSLGQIFSERRVNQHLQSLFEFRTRRLKSDLGLLRRYGPGKDRLVAITGSTGLIGTALGQLIEAGGYRVLRISRSRRGGDGWVYWDPSTGTLSPEALEGVYAVVHLAGESIAAARWTSGKKDAILKSREEGTLLLSRTLAELDRPPEVLVSASAVGYYGHHGDEFITEEGDSGRGFLAEVCQRWEASTHAARAVGIRTVHMRSGLVLSPSGGPLRTLLTLFNLGLGGRIGSGRQYLSWIDLDDHTGMILHAMREHEVRGPLNSTSPNPLTNSAFTNVLGRVLRRPTLLPVPAVALRVLLGEMGVELLLSGQRVIPEKAIRTGYQFLFPDLEDSLRHQLGRMEDGNK